MKKTIALVLALLFALSPLTALAEGTATPTPASSETPAAPTPTPAPENYFRRAEDPAEYVEIDEDNAHWEYRSDDLSVIIDDGEYTTADGRVASYYVANIRMRNANAYKSYLAVENGRSRKRPRLMAHTAQAVLFATGDGLLASGKASSRGLLIRNGKVYSEKQAIAYMAMLPDMTMKIYEPGETTPEALLAAGVLDTYSCGPVFIKDGVVNENADQELNIRVKGRMAIGMVEAGHFVILVSDGPRGDFATGIPGSEMTRIFQEYGCVQAYNLMTAELVSVSFMGELVNGAWAMYYKQKKNRLHLSSFADGLVFGTSELVPKDTEHVYGGKRFSPWIVD